ncbi:MAG: leucyl/phenylalanyl-tRNA--protein transferase [Phycisphaerales bacterium]
MLSRFLEQIPDDFTDAEAGSIAQGISMYLRGWFPMYDSASDRVEWVQGDKRAIVPLDGRFNVARSLRTKVRRAPFEVTADECLVRVMRHCGERTLARLDTWIHEDIIALFDLYRRAGLAHSIEVWNVNPHGERVLVGGLYGVAFGRVFCGESMFSRPELGGTDASKIALVHLVGHLRRRGFAVLDAQLSNSHMAQFGTHEIGRRAYLAELRKRSKESAEWGAFDASACAAAGLATPASSIPIGDGEASPQTDGGEG